MEARQRTRAVAGTRAAAKKPAAPASPKKPAAPAAPKTRGRAESKTGCPVESALAVIGGRWKGVVLYWLTKGTLRFGELRRLLPNCTQRMLTLQLRELEQEGLVKRTVFAEVPPRVEYELTHVGRTLIAPLDALDAWAREHLPVIEQARVTYDGTRTA